MKQIHEKKVVMRPKAYFVIGSFLTFIGIVFLTFTAVFLAGLVKFSLRTHGPMGQYRLEQIMTSFPWWAPILVVISLSFGIWLLKKYDFSYKKNFWLIVLSLISAVILAGWLIDKTGLSDTWYRKGPMGNFMRRYIEQDDSRFINKDNSQPKFNVKGARSKQGIW